VGERSGRRKIVPGGAYPTDVMQTVSTPPPVPAFLATPSSPKAEVAPALVRAEGPLARGARVHVDPDEVVVLVRDGAVDGVLTAETRNPADYTGAEVYRVSTAVFEGLGFGGPVPLQGVRGVSGAADVQVTDPVRLVQAMVAHRVSPRDLDVWLSDQMMDGVADVLVQLHGRAKAHAIIGGIIASTAAMEEAVGVVARDIGRIRLLK